MLSAHEPGADENRFGALLNPIRDITASWGVDIAKELTDYALSLGLDISNEHATSQTHNQAVVQVDFAKAALLVQGSTSIYSRKVEHLYNLVYVAVSSFDHMQGNKPSNTGDKHNAAKDADADALLQLDEHDFLTLDDDIPTADPKTITLADQRSGNQDRLHDETRRVPVPPILAFRTNDSSHRIGGVEFKILSAHTHPSGALIMPGCPPVNEDLTTLPPRNDVPNTDIGTTPQLEDNPDDFDHDGGENFSGELPIGDMPGSDDGPGSVVANDGPKSKSQIILQAAARYGFTRSMFEGPSERPKDPFLMLNPHEEAPHLNKPLKVSKTYKRPKKGPASRQLAPSPWLEGSKLSMFHTAVKEIPRTASVRRHVSFSALQPAAAVISRRRNAAMRKAALRASEEGGSAAEMDQNGVYFYEDEDPDIDRNMGDEGGGFERDDIDDFTPLEHPSLENALEEVGRMGAEDLLRDTEERAGDDFARIASSFEETCRKHLERTAWMWEQQSTDVELVRRVEDWRARIQPLLDEEETRGEFDISSCGEGIIHNLQEELEEKSNDRARVSTLLAQPAQFEVCRQFLATLQLANHYRLEILPPVECCVSDFEVKILEPSHSNQVATNGKKATASSKRPRSPVPKRHGERRQALRPRLVNREAEWT